MKLVCINEQSRRRGSIGPNGTPTGITQFINDLNQQGKLSSADRAALANNPNKSQYRRNEKGKNCGDMDRLRSRQRTHVDVVDQNDFDEDVHNRIGEFVERGILTKQQGAVIDQMAHGLTVKDIAAKLGLSTTRISQHMKVALPKFKRAWIQWKNTELPEGDQIPEDQAPTKSSAMDKISTMNRLIGPALDHQY